MKVQLRELRPGDVLFDPSTESDERLTVEGVQHLGPVVIVDFDDSTSTPPLGGGVIAHVESRRAEHSRSNPVEGCNCAACDDLDEDWA